MQRSAADDDITAQPGRAVSWATFPANARAASGRIVPPVDGTALQKALFKMVQEAIEWESAHGGKPEHGQT